MNNVVLDQTSVSVVITAYNRPDYLRSAIRSALIQTHTVQEIIVIDDCSPTSLESVIGEFSDERINYLRLANNGGPNRARNKGVEVANGRWIAFLDDDDEWLPHKIEKQLQLLRASSANLDWVGSVCSYRFLETGKERVWGATGKVSLAELKTGNPYCGTSGLIALRDKILEVGFDETLPCGQDWDMFIRLSMLGDLIYVQEPLFLYRRGAHDSVTLKSKTLQIDELEPRLASIYKHRAWLGERPFRLRVAAQALAYFPQKKNRVLWIKESIRLAGVTATLQVLVRKFHSRVLGGRA